MKYQLIREQQLNCTIERAWDFFSSPLNLADITPKDMNFQVLTQMNGERIYEGMLIEYKVSPILHIPMHWVTKIVSVDYHKSFTDFQSKGPYKLWNHYHEFVQNEKGILMKDVVDYELPLGFLGSLAHVLFVKKRIEDIFNYRFNVLEGLFNK